VVQRYQEQQEEYKQIVQRIQEKSVDRYRRKQKNNLSLIYERLMGIM
jgi:hypothetical protein